MIVPKIPLRVLKIFSIFVAVEKSTKDIDESVWLLSCYNKCDKPTTPHFLLRRIRNQGSSRQISNDMANNYFSCVVSGNKTYLKDPEGRMKLLNLCKECKAFFLEKGQPEGALSEVCAGDIIFLSFRQYIVAYGEVTDIQYDGLDNCEYRCAIKVKDWVWPNENYKKGMFIRGDVSNYSVSGTARGDKIKRLSGEVGEQIMSQLH